MLLVVAGAAVWAPAPRLKYAERAEMLNSIHFLLTYACNFECDHCFLFCGPGSKGTFTIHQLRSALDAAAEVGGIESVFFEGGEPMLFFPLLAEGIREACRRGFKVGIVTNSYWGTSAEDAALWMRPLREAGLTSVTISDDPLHYGDAAGAHAQRIQDAAKDLGMHVDVLCKQRPSVQPAGADDAGEPAIAGGVKFRGRAVRKLLAGLPTRPWEQLARCPFENLAQPQRVHADCYGHLHLCQGISMGNFWESPLRHVVRNYDPQAHPIAGPLLRGGPAQLARELDVPHEGQYVDECHMCFELRLALMKRFPGLLCPPQVYGL